MAHKLPTSLVRRAAATGRIAAHLGKAAAKRVLSRSEEDDAALGEGLFTELDRLKGLAMKVGQIISYMEVGLPDATVERLARLQRGAQPLPIEAIAKVIEADFGAPLGSLFERFDPEPIAAASVGQVHRAKLRGAEVAVKVRYEGVRETLLADTRQLGAIASVASLATSVDGPALVAELRDRLMEECDYAREADNQRYFAEILAGDPALVVPEVCSDRCSERVLTTTFQRGAPFEALITAPKARRDAVARALMRLPWTTLLQRGILHADPHPGNFLFPEGDRVVVLDFGCVRRFDERNLSDLRALIEVVLADDVPRMLPIAARIGLAPRPDKIDVEELWQLLCFLFAPYRAERFSFTRAWWSENMSRFKSPSARNNRYLGFPPEWMWLQRTLIGLHAVLLKLDATVDGGLLVRELLAGPPRALRAGAL